MAEYKKEAGLLIAAAVIVVLVLAGVSVYLFPSQGSESPAGSSPLLTIVPNSLVCTSYASCQITVQNTGAAIGWISGAGPTSGSVTFSTCPASIQAPGQTTFNLTVSGGSPGKAVQGYLIPSTGGYLHFSVTLPLSGPTTNTPTTCRTGTATNSTSSY